MSGYDDFDSDRLREEARAALRELVVDLRDLEEALRQFANQAAFVDAFARRRNDAGAAKLVGELEWPLTSLVNQLNTVLSLSVVLGGLISFAQAGVMPHVYTALHDHGIIGRSRHSQLSRLNHVRNRLEHHYGTLTDGCEVHSAAALAVGVAGQFGHDYGDWLRKIGVLDRHPARHHP